jgi:hypothetical protein
MRKTIRTSHHLSQLPSVDPDHAETPPGRIKGATITSWRGPPEVDLTSLFARSATGVTVSGALGGAKGGAKGGVKGGVKEDHEGDASGKPAQAAEPSSAAAKTVSLSDGTQITFATATGSIATQNI